MPVTQRPPATLNSPETTTRTYPVSGGQCRSRSGLGLVDAVVCTLSLSSSAQTAQQAYRARREDKEYERHIQDFLQTHAHLTCGLEPLVLVGLTLRPSAPPQ